MRLFRFIGYSVGYIFFLLLMASRAFSSEGWTYLSIIFVDDQRMRR